MPIGHMNKWVIQKLNMHQKHRGEKEREREKKHKSSKIFDEEYSFIPLLMKIQDIWSLGYPYTVQHTLDLYSSHSKKKKTTS